MSSITSSCTGKFLIYKDIGANIISCESLYLLLFRRFPFQPIEFINSHYLIHGNWEKATLLVLPGGNEDACTIWERNLGASGMKKIQDYVKVHGGKILGICAGAYFVSKESYYDRADIGLKSRLFPLYNGTASGPIKPISLLSTMPSSPLPAVGQVVKLFNPTSGAGGGCYYRGGPAFMGAAGSPEATTLATYDREFYECGEGTAIAHFLDEEGKGDGEGVVSGVHFEIEPKKKILPRSTPSPLSNDLIDSLGRLAEDLSAAEDFRKRLEHDIFDALGLMSEAGENGIEDWYEEQPDGTVTYRGDS